MNFLLLMFLILIGIIVLDFVLMLFRLRMRGVILGYKILFLGGKYRSDYYTLERKVKNKVLIIGDSTVFGPGADKNETLPALLGSKYNISVTNLSKNGGKTGEIISQLNKVKNRKFGLTIVFAGNNDIWRFTDINKFKRDMSELLEKAKKNSRRVVLFRGGNIGNCPLFPISLALIYTYRSRKFREIAMKICRDKGVVYVEKWMERKDDIFLKNFRKFYFWDLNHLNGEGFKIWFDYLMEEMKKRGISLPKLKEKNTHK